MTKILIESKFCLKIRVRFIIKAINRHCYSVLSQSRHFVVPLNCFREWQPRRICTRLSPALCMTVDCSSVRLLDPSMTKEVNQWRHWRVPSLVIFQLASENICRYFLLFGNVV